MLYTFMNGMFIWFAYRWSLRQRNTFDDELRVSCTFFDFVDNTIGNDNFSGQSSFEI